MEWRQIGEWLPIGRCPLAKWLLLIVDARQVVATVWRPAFVAHH